MNKILISNVKPTQISEVDVLERNQLARFLVSASVDAAEAALPQKLLLRVLVYDLRRVEVTPLVVVVQSVAVSQIDNIIIVQLDALLIVYA